jgi:hypothetical protein
MYQVCSAHALLICLLGLWAHNSQAIGCPPAWEKAYAAGACCGPALDGAVLGLIGSNLRPNRPEGMEARETLSHICMDVFSLDDEFSSHKAEEH